MNDVALNGTSPQRSGYQESTASQAFGASHWPAAGGEMGERIRTHDWAATPLGPIQTWPQSLRTIVDLMLASQQPVYVAWGAQLTSLYNDNYLPILGIKHPKTLGRPYSEVWPEIWDEYRPIAAATMAGEAQHFIDRPVPLAGRPGRPMSWFTFSWTPIRDEAGGVAGFYCAATETTDKVLTEDALREGQEVALRETDMRYHALFEALDQGFCIVEMIFDEQNRPVDYVFAEVNPIFEEQTGLYDAAGKSMRSLQPTHEDYWFDIYGRVALTGEPARFEHEAAALDRWYDVFAYRIGNPEQRRVAILFDDITGRKLAENARRESEERLRQVQEAARIGSFEFDRRTNKAITSPEYLELYGLPEDLSGFFSYDDWIALVHPEDRPWIEAETRAAVADPSRNQLDYEFRILRADNGEMRWITARTKLLRDDKGRFVRSLGAQWDITAEKDAQTALHESEERYRSFIAHSSEGIWLLEFDPPLDVSLPVEKQVELAYRHGRFVECNDAMAEMYGLARAEDLIGKTLEFSLPSSDPEARAFLAGVIRSGYNLTGVESVELDAAGNHKHFDNSMTGIVENGQLKRLWGIQRDITDRKQAEDQRTLLIHELNHRVKNTLATVQSIASQTLRNAPTMRDAKEALEGRLIALARAHDVLTRESWEGAELREIVAQAVAPYAGRGEDRLHLQGPEVRLSPRMALALAMALQELATNAVKYGALSNSTGEIGISWKVEQTHPPRLHLTWEESGSPPVQAPSRRGFGSKLIERSLAQELNGAAQIEFRPTGIVCTVDAPLA
ncbi:HWE histidine kinase domain-containing protein [Microvirga sp. VF16]|uniref:PAS domain-containing sensor histidine kinase n=1 Tax=Microvirga sp. VF16 TaxID=2807101 RepID=UPI00193CF593|nr:HWE histidine kinase domain-containing protein [Microvirga sp. VF16]QRM31108.1 PAS domain S-box protein [Microvirga sp. VF16]